MKLVALRINQYTRSSSLFQKGWWPLKWCMFLHFIATCYW